MLVHLCSKLDDATIDEVDRDDEDDAALFGAMLVDENPAQCAEQPNPGLESDIENHDIYTFNDEWTLCPTTFLGACINAGAQKKVLGMNQASTYLNQTKNSNSVLHKDQKGQKFFNFEIATTNELGCLV